MIKRLLSSNLSRNVGTYATANLLTAAIPFLLLPLLTRVLGTSDYGLVSMFLVLTNLYVPFVGFNAQSALVRQYYDRESISFPKFVNSVVFIIIISVAILVVVTFMFKDQIAGFSDVPVFVLWWVLVFIVLRRISDIILDVWRAQSKAMSYGVFRVSRALLEIGLSFYLLLELETGWEGRIHAQVLSVALFTLVALYYLYRHGFLTSGIKKEYIVQALKYGVPLIPHALGAVMIGYADRIFVTKMVSLDAMGLYSVGFQVGASIGLIQNSFNQAWAPWFFEKLKSGEDIHKKFIVKFTWLYFGAMIALVGILSLLLPFIFQWLIGNEFASASEFVLWIATAFALNGMYKMVVNYLFYTKHTIYIGALTIITALINLALNYILIKENGAIGAAQASAAAFGIQFILAWLISARIYPMPWFRL